MNDDVPVRKRAGGRAARKALRAAKPPISEAPVRPGMEGGQYLPLTESEILRIHHAALNVLEQIGLINAIPSCIEIFTSAGASISEEGRLVIPRAMVEDALATAARHFPLYAQDPKYDLEPWGKKVHFGTAGAAVHMVDAETGEYRESMLNDLYDVARLVDTLDNIHFYQRSLVPRDMIDPRDLDFNTCYAAVVGTSKHVGSSWVHTDHLAETMEMLHLIAGGEDKWRARPFVSMSACFVVPPLNFAEDACRCLEAGVRAGMPILLLAAGQAGATSPAALPGAVVQEVAEVLAGLVYVNLIVPGHPAIFGAWPFVSDLRTGAMSGGSGEQAVLMAACAQMAQYYDLTGGIAGGMTDSKVPDAQAGYEKGYTNALAGLAGGNLVYESAGMHASLLGCCFESYVIDNDIIGSVLRTVRGLEVTDETLSVEAIREACIGGPGHFLGSNQTLELMERDYIYPEVGDRSSPKEWAENGSTDIRQRARAKVQEVLASHYPSHIDEAMDDRIREKFDVKLPRKEMRPGNGRW
ncbi:MAG: trimethylamine methyltransferase family protein [Alphaproteobacteria bacterium]